MALAGQAHYPVQLTAHYPDEQSRWKAALRFLLGIPVLIFALLLQGGVVPAIWATILVSRRIPRWLFDFQVAVGRWQIRAASYLLLLTDEYPPFEGEYPIDYDVRYPAQSSRWKLVIWKFVTSIPHFVVLGVLTLTLLPVAAIAWLALLMRGRHPPTLHGYAVGVIRWQARVQAYLFSLTDAFPPFSLSADAGEGGRNAYLFSSTTGMLAFGGVIAGLVTIAIVGIGEHPSTEVSYERLLAGEVRPGETRLRVNSAVVELAGATDPADELYPFLEANAGHRLVEFALAIENVRPTSGPDLRRDCFTLKDTEGHSHDSLLVVIDGRIPPTRIDKHDVADAGLLFELPLEVRPLELRYVVIDCTIPVLPKGETMTYEFR